LAEKVFENPNQSLGTYVERHAEKSPNKPALFFEDRSWTWNQFNREANQAFVKKDIISMK